jgi:hypothetical protein
MPGKSGWGDKELGENDQDGKTLYLDVDTSRNQYNHRPRYFTALTGVYKNYRATGAHVIYFPRSASFRVYMVGSAYYYYYYYQFYFIFY